MVLASWLLSLSARFLRIRVKSLGRGRGTEPGAFPARERSCILPLTARADNRPRRRRKLWNSQPLVLESRQMLHGIADPDIILSSSNIDENQPGGTLVGIVSGAGANAVYELVSGPFTLAGDELRSHTQFDHEAQSSYNIVIRAYPAEGPALERTLQVSIGDVVEAPTIVVTRLSGDVYENQTSQSILLQVGVDPGDAGFGPLALAGGRGHPLQQVAASFAA